MEDATLAHDRPEGADAPGADAGPAQAPGELDVATLQRALLALSTGDVDAAVGAIAACTEVAESTRDALARALLSAEEPGARARALGDVVRAHGLGRELANEAYRAAFYLSGRSEDLAANPLYAWFLAHRAGPAVDKWVHYFPIYHRHLERFRGRDVRVLEIGVYRGGGLAMWQHYFGPDARVVGLDVDPAARAAAGQGAVVELGDQADPEVLRRVERAHGPFDVVIDDGGHRMDQQRAVVETLFPLLAPGGVLIVEDCHTSYWPEYGGALGRPGTFLEWVKARVDDLHAVHTTDVSLDTVWAERLGGLHVYDSVVVLDAEDRFRPFSEVSGTSTYLRVDREAEAHLVDLVAARDAARAQADELEAEIARLHAAGVGTAAAAPTPQEVGAAGDESAEELRRLQSALRYSQAQLLDVGLRATGLETELASVNGRLVESWEQIKLMRRSVSWRVTAPLRAVRGLRQ